MPYPSFDHRPGRPGERSSEMWRRWAGLAQSGRRQAVWAAEQASYRLVERGAAVLGGWAAGHPPKVARRCAGAPAATMADVVACYRLMLGRQPDPGGPAHYRRRLTEADLSTGELAGEFLGSVEFARTHQLGHPGGPRATEVVTACEGFRIHVDPADFAVGHTLARTGSYEPDVSAALRRVLSPGQTFVDIGANIGWFSLLGASLVGPAGRVVAVEPNPLNVTLLRDSAKDNGFDNIEVVAVALGRSPCAVALETDGSNGRVISIDGPPAEPVEASFVVAAQPLDAVLERAGVDHVDAMKIDVEGAEPLVLEGATGTIARDRPVIVSEFYPLALDCSPWGSAQGYLGSLRALGYCLEVIGTEGDQDDDAIMSAAGGAAREQVDLLARPLASAC
ncbi:MAG: FkbM family methyltransferase [Acidimicrobiales bacterium]